MGQLSYPDKYFVNADVKTMALSMLDEAGKIRDEDPFAAERRAHLLRAASHLLSAAAELAALDSVVIRSDAIVARALREQLADAADDAVRRGEPEQR